MPRNGTGTYSLPEPSFVSGTVISSAAMNDDLNDIASALTGSLPRDGQAGMSGQFTAVDGSAALPSISFNNEDDSGFFHPATGQIGVVVQGTQVLTFNSNGINGLLPVGVVLDFAGSTIPGLWYLCYGQAVSRTTYSLLFAVIGTTYGSGDGITTFNLPDYRGLVLAGVDNMGGSAAGRLTSTFYGTSPDVLAALGGQQSVQLGTSNLPAYTPSGGLSGSVTVNSTSPNFQFTTGVQGAASGGGFNAPVNNGATVVSTGLLNGGGSTGAFVGNAQGGASVAFTLIQPTITSNKMIYAGA